MISKDVHTIQSVSSLPPRPNYTGNGPLYFHENPRYTVHAHLDQSVVRAGEYILARLVELDAIDGTDTVTVGSEQRPHAF